MADLRLSHASQRVPRRLLPGLVLGPALLVVAGCGSAGAQPDPASGITPPTGWQRLEPAETAAKLAAAAPNVTVAGVQAWGEPALGCYALWLSLRGSGGDAESIARDLIAGLTAAKFTVADTPVVEGVLELAIERAPSEQGSSGYRGQLRARVGDGQLTGLACVANQRDPAACEVGCKAMLGAIR